MDINCFNIQRFSTGDGIGIRTTVFLSGCNLHCPWCHNPEGLYGQPDMRTIEHIVDDVMADEEFYIQSNGGVTLSGGEPLCHPKECLTLLRIFKEKGLNTVIDTALALDIPDLGEIASYTDTFLADLKTADAQKFRDVCGGDLEKVYANIQFLQRIGKDIIIRVPLIPGFNMDDASIDGLINKIKEFNLPVTLLPFHRMGSKKYEELGQKYAYAAVEPSSKEEIAAIKERFAANGIKEAVV